MKRMLCVIQFLVLALPLAATAQQRFEVPRGDGATTPLVVFEPEAARPCPPLALLSHGAGGSAQHNLSYLGQALSHAGWRAVAIGHAESGPAPLRDDMQAAGWKQGLIDLITDKRAYAARFLDIDAALRWSDAKCHAPYKALIGHSMGAITVMLVAGARNTLDIDASKSIPRGTFDAFVALSPEGPGIVFPDNAWHPIKAPMLLVTGTRDGGLGGDYTWRTRAFDGLGAGCHALAVVDGASHMNLGGLDTGATTAKVAALTRSYLDGLRGAHCPRLVAGPGVTLRSK